MREVGTAARRRTCITGKDQVAVILEFLLELAHARRRSREVIRNWGAERGAPLAQKRTKRTTFRKRDRAEDELGA
jgi:hypothetical protein